MLKRNNIYFYIFFLLLFSNYRSNCEIGYRSVHSIISDLKLTVQYNVVKSELILTQKHKKVVLLQNSPYIKIGTNYVFFNELIRNQQGQFYIPQKAVPQILNYFSGSPGLPEGEEKKASRKMPEQKTAPEKARPLKSNTALQHNFKINAIVVDAGHGGKDPGAYWFDLKEKDIVLRTVLLLETKLKTFYKDKKIVLTRDKDIFVPLEERADLANQISKKYGPSLFISIHANASFSPRSYGFETWYIIDEFRKQIIKKGEISKDKDVEFVLNAMLNEEIYIESKFLAKKIQDQLEKNIGDVSRNRGIKENTYIVIKEPIMPAVLVEIGFISNKYEANRLTKYSYLSKIASGIFNGIREFVNEYENSKGFTR